MDDESASEDETGGLLVKRPKTAEQLAKEEEDYRAFLLENLSKSENARESMGDWLSYKADRDGKSTARAADPEEAFLIDFVLSRGWVDQEKRAGVPDYERIINEDEEDLEAVERAEEFETAMNFRFEQPGADQITTYARTIEGSMRRDDNKRKEARAAKKTRKEAEATQLKEDLKRQKNVLKGSLVRKLAKIQQVADLPGKEVAELDEALDLDGSDFDLEEHDRKMAGLFNADFYGADDTEKPVFSSDDEYDAYINEGRESEDDEEAAASEAGGAKDEPLDSCSESDNEFRPKIIERPAKTKASSAKDEIAKLKEELYKLDCEDVIGGLDDPDAIKCRFRYTSSIPAAFGLESREILAADEALLNQHVSLKKLAPYRPVERQKEDIRKYGDKRKVYMLKKKMWDQQVAEREARKARKAAKKQNEPVSGK
jgi:protein KRI1